MTEGTARNRPLPLCFAMVIREGRRCMIALVPPGFAALNTSRRRATRLVGIAQLAAGNAAVAVRITRSARTAELAPLVAAVAFEIMPRRIWLQASDRPRAGTPVARAEAHRLTIGPDGVATLVETTDARILEGRHACAAIYLGASVVRDGVALGRTVMEPNVLVENGSHPALEREI